MPLFGGKQVEITVLDCKAGQMVFTIEQTGESFKHLEDYLKRMHFYSQTQFRVNTSSSIYTFFEALYFEKNGTLEGYTAKPLHRTRTKSRPSHSVPGAATSKPLSSKKSRLRSHYLHMYPCEESQLPPRTEEPHFTPFNPFSTDQDNITITHLMTVWHFVTTFSKCLKLDPVPLKDLVDALEYTPDAGADRPGPFYPLWNHRVVPLLYTYASRLMGLLFEDKEGDLSDDERVVLRKPQSRRTRRPPASSRFLGVRRSSRSASSKASAAMRTHTSPAAEESSSQEDLYSSDPPESEESSSSEEQHPGVWPRRSARFVAKESLPADSDASSTTSDIGEEDELSTSSQSSSSSSSVQGALGSRDSIWMRLVINYAKQYLEYGDPTTTWVYNTILPLEDTETPFHELSVRDKVRILHWMVLEDLNAGEIRSTLVENDEERKVLREKRSAVRARHAEYMSQSSQETRKKSANSKISRLRSQISKSKSDSRIAALTEKLEIARHLFARDNAEHVAECAATVAELDARMEQLRPRREMLGMDRDQVTYFYHEGVDSLLAVDSHGAWLQLSKEGTLHLISVLDDRGKRERPLLQALSSCPLIATLDDKQKYEDEDEDDDSHSIDEDDDAHTSKKKDAPAVLCATTVLDELSSNTTLPPFMRFVNTGFRGEHFIGQLRLGHREIRQLAADKFGWKEEK